MMTCDVFRTRFAPGADDAAILGHIRSCDPCLDFAAGVDPDVMFRALGGDEMVPPGGVDAFVDEVMQQVRVRTAESTMAARRTVVPWTRRLAVAATIAAGITGGMLVYRSGEPTVVPTSPVLVARQVAPVTAEKLATKPVVETYESESATIVEVPAEETGEDVKIVMIFDESLPADL